MIPRLVNYGRHLAKRPGRVVVDSVRAITARAMGRSALRDGQPWMPWDAIDFLRESVGPESNVFEYGSGGSTIFLGNLGATVVSVEHDEDWSRVVRERLDEAGLDTVDHRCILPETGRDGGYTSPVRGYRGMSFRSYVHAIDEFPDGHFDLVIVDGRARNDCARVALSKIREGGILLLDNSERDRYRATQELLAAFPGKTFRGLNPYQLDPGESKAWTVACASKKG
ncbi:MAG: hypothetical protein JJU11_07575 [Candidatus Sumerlaeia bacterium]|nr:hypothetical protein [Candidatus Sumerlaeia bacterium]